MIDAPLALAFTAGLVATVNPCGFAMLPAYLSWYVGVEGTTADQAAGLPERLGRALGVGTTVSLGFLVVFGVTGALVSAGVRSFIDYVPWVAMIIGVALAALGIALLAGRELNVALPKPEVGTGSRRLRSMVAFGASYAVASLSCTLPVFLAVVASTFTRTDLVSGIATFVAYATGMSVVLVSVTIAVALAQHSLVVGIRRLTRYVNRIAGGLLVVAGGYIVYYWAFNLSAGPGEMTGAGPARFVEGLSADATAWFQRLGWRAALLLFGGAIAAAAAVAILARRPPSPPDAEGDASNDGAAAHTEPPTVRSKPARATR